MDPKTDGESPYSSELTLYCGAAFLAIGSATALALLKWTSLTPLASVTCGIGAGLVAVILAALAWLKIRMLRLRRDLAAPDAFQRVSKYPHVAELLKQHAADEKELGIDAATKSFAERNVQELGRLLDELERSPEYQAADAAAKEAMMQEVVEAHHAATAREIEAAGKRSAERIAALRELREFERAIPGDRKPTPEERFHMDQLREKAHGPGR